MAETKKERYRRVRGAILKLLAHQHPGPLDIREIHFLLDDLRLTIREEELRSHLFYLEERGLIKSDERKSGGIRVEMIRITADGLNILDGFARDIGVDTRF
jgi:DNA-binding transcriptional ArsR family regulator